MLGDLIDAIVALFTNGVPARIEDEITEQVYFLLDVYNAEKGLNIPRPRVTFDLYDDRWYATASLNRWRIRFNPDRIRAKYEHVYSVTTRHELAHLITRYRYGRGPLKHGIEFQDVFRDLGGESAEAIEAALTEPVLND